mmetsp:Transcript_184512/g.585078  ORF Transcript_184512/g.585078 Transcript_184512/m.585078 type:complete len:223 (-) Transcript_184512:2198-2866(-)
MHTFAQQPHKQSTCDFSLSSVAQACSRLTICVLVGSQRQMAVRGVDVHNHHALVSIGPGRPQLYSRAARRRIIDELALVESRVGEQRDGRVHAVLPLQSDVGNRPTLLAIPGSGTSVDVPTAAILACDDSLEEGFGGQVLERREDASLSHDGAKLQVVTKQHKLLIAGEAAHREIHLRGLRCLVNDQCCKLQDLSSSRPEDPIMRCTIASREHNISTADHTL